MTKLVFIYISKLHGSHIKIIFKTSIKSAFTCISCCIHYFKNGFIGTTYKRVCQQKSFAVDVLKKKGRYLRDPNNHGGGIHGESSRITF